MELDWTPTRRLPIWSTEDRMLLEYVSGGRVAIITVNRPPSGATAATEFDVIKQRALA